MPGWQIKETPGHTPGHVSLYRPQDRVLLPGDAFCTTKPESFFDAAIKQEPELHGPPAYFTSDWNQARQSLQKLANLEPETVATEGTKSGAPAHPVSGNDCVQRPQGIRSRIGKRWRKSHR
jgi:glyoxylase-like metal-dependent hydrolase (beta-lactamase superfamily II)